MPPTNNPAWFDTIGVVFRLPIFLARIVLGALLIPFGVGIAILHVPIFVFYQVPVGFLGALLKGDFGEFSRALSDGPWSGLQASFQDAAASMRKSWQFLLRGSTADE